MWPMTDRMIAALPHGHSVAASVQVLDGDVVLADLVTEGMVVGGNVSFGHAEISRTATLSLVDHSGTWTPRDIDDLLAPSGRQIRLWRGVQFGVNDADLVPLITARFTKVPSTFPRIELSQMYDRAWIVQGAKLDSVLSVAAGTSVIAAIEGLILAAYPGVPLNLPQTDEVTSSMVFDVDADPWVSAQDLAANIGYRLMFDPMGTATMYAEPDPSDQPSWEFDDTSYSNMALAATGAEWDGEGFNACLAIAENSSLPAPLRALVKDLDPNSPTQYGGRYGRRLMVVRDDKMASQAQVQARAVHELTGQLGLYQTVTVPAMVNPAFTAGDVVRINITRPSQTNKPPIANVYAIVDSGDIPVRASTGQTIQMAARRVVVLE